MEAHKPRARSACRMAVLFAQASLSHGRPIRYGPSVPPTRRSPHQQCKAPCWCTRTNGDIDHLHRRVMAGGERIHDAVPDASLPPRRALLRDANGSRSTTPSCLAGRSTAPPAMKRLRRRGRPRFLRPRWKARAPRGNRYRRGSDPRRAGRPVRRARARAAETDLVLWMMDAQHEQSGQEGAAPLWTVRNKNRPSPRG